MLKYYIIYMVFGNIFGGLLKIYIRFIMQSLDEDEGRIVLLNLNDEIKEIIELAGFDEFIEL